MFSGLIQHICKVSSIKGHEVKVLAPKTNYKRGESIAINGVCLTATTIKKAKGGVEISFDLTDETLQKTDLASLKAGSQVNFERALRLTDFLGGHMVQGHVDGVGCVRKIEAKKSGKDIWFLAPAEILQYVVPKGSVTVNGVSLTAVEVTDDSFSVALIPETLTKTTLGTLEVGDNVNLEADVFAKYVQKFISNQHNHE